MIHKAVFLAAGRGTRFRPLSDFIPKELVPLGRTPLIGHLLNEVSTVGIEEAILVSGLQKKPLEEYFRYHAGRLGIRPQIAFQMVPRGTADAVWRVRDLVGEENFLLYYSDDLWLPDEGAPGFNRAEQLIWCYVGFGAPVISLMRVPPQEVPRFGIAAVSHYLREEVALLQGLVEKPSVAEAPSTLAVVSGMVLTPAVVEASGRLAREKRESGSEGEAYLTEAFAGLPLLGCILRGEWVDVGVLDRYPAAFARVAEREG